MWSIASALRAPRRRTLGSQHLPARWTVLLVVVDERVQEYRRGAVIVPAGVH